MSRGAALPATVFALAITSAMAVGGLHVAQRHRAATLDRSAATVLRSMAETRVVTTVLSWDSLARAHQAVGVTAADSGAGSTVSITRTGELEYLIVAEVRTSGRPVLYHRVGATVVIVAGRPRLPFPRAWAQMP